MEQAQECKSGPDPLIQAIQAMQAIQAIQVIQIIPGEAFRQPRRDPDGDQE